jgi:hypothetical protein
MFERKIRFNQWEDMIVPIKNLLIQEPKLANQKIPFLEGRPTMQELWEKSTDGCCWGIAANVVAHLENPMLTMKSQLIRVESCVQAFKSAISAITGNKYALTETLILQDMQDQVEDWQRYRNPPYMESPFSMWFLEANETAQHKGWVHAIVTTNNKALGAYFVFDSNDGLFQSTPEFTQELNNKLQQKICQGMRQADAIKEIIRKAAFTFAEVHYKERPLYLIRNIPYMSSRDVFYVAENFKARIRRHLGKLCSL